MFCLLTAKSLHFLEISTDDENNDGLSKIKTNKKERKKTI